ncbi:hypothetical protein VTK26DRAFT_4802 [Humicola hyalothermophila]
MATPTLSPQKKPMPPMDPSRKVSGTLTAEGAANAAAALGLASDPAIKPGSLSTRASAMAGAGSLITPAKTPQKPPTDQVKAKVKSVARNLFGNDDDVMPSPRKTRSQTTYGLDSFSESTDESFQIYTDSHERIPEIDTSAENPFYVTETTAIPEPPRRRSKHQTVTIPGEGKVPIDEVVRRDDGILTVFRGKKQFRKFTENIEVEGGLESAVESTARRPFTRSSIKPRLLFPVVNADDSSVANEDEEAVTDIEDHVLAGEEPGSPATPVDLLDKEPGTPEAPRFAPASPPTTARTTRFGSKKASEATPMKTKTTAKRSPFDGWPRVKSGAHSGSHKRQGDELSSAGPKRTRA